ncbi:hypothetical protein OG21DRAFT_1588309 [Imleria badia]|nr:hypothetical protein OG21DRAFT_1588309 [Imleria badia]
MTGITDLGSLFNRDTEVCIGVNFTSSLQAEEIKDRARKALDKLRFVCPIIACTVEDAVSPRWVYTPSADRNAWLKLALAVEERGTSLNPYEFIQSIILKRLPYMDGSGITILFRAYLLTTSNERDDGIKEDGLYFHGSHAIIDGGPALHALNLMCEWMSGEGMDVRIEPPEEWKNLPVDPITATGGPCKEWETAGTRLLQEFGEQNARTVPGHTLPPPSCPLNMSHPPFHYTITASELETAAVIAETEKLGVSVSALFHTAHCMAMIKMNPVPEGTEVDFSGSLTSVALERYMQPPVNLRTNLISSLTLMPSRFSLAPVLTERSEKGRLIKTAKMLQECYDRYLSDPALPHLFTAMQGMLFGLDRDRIGEPGDEPETKAAPMPWWCTFNNLGVVEKRLQTQHGRITVDSMCLGTRFKSIMGVYMWTMHSKFCFRVQGATAWGEECMKTMLEETKRIGFLVLDES